MTFWQWGREDRIAFGIPEPPPVDEHRPEPPTLPPPAQMMAQAGKLTLEQVEALKFVCREQRIWANIWTSVGDIDAARKAREDARNAMQKLIAFGLWEREK